MLLATGSILVASRELGDPNFMRTVVYLVEHGDSGTLGFIINRPVDIKLSDLWAECPSELADTTIAAEGGPVDRHKGLLLHTCLDLSGAAPIGEGLAVGGDIEALAARFAAGPDLSGPRLFLGHSGWAPGQLASEIAQGSWIVRPGEPGLLLDTRPEPDLWHRLLDGGSLPEPSLN